MNPQNTQTPTKQPSKNPMVFVAIALVVLLVIFGIVGYVNSKKSSDDSAVIDMGQQTDVPTEGQASIYLEPAQSEVSVGETLTISVNVDTNDQPVNAVEANLSYPTDLFEFVGIDDTDSGFTINVEKTGLDGKITIVRGQADSVTGKALLAKINLKAKSTGEATITFNDDTRLVKADKDSTNITGPTTGGTYSIKE